MNKVECAKKMKEVLQLMRLWPEDVDLLSPDTDPARKLIYCAGDKPPLDGWIDSKRKMQLFQALAENEIFPRDVCSHGFVDVDIDAKLKDIPVIVRLSAIEKAIRSERLQNPPAEGHGKPQGRGA